MRLISTQDRINELIDLGYFDTSFIQNLLEEGYTYCIVKEDCDMLLLPGEVERYLKLKAFW